MPETLLKPVDYFGQHSVAWTGTYVLCDPALIEKYETSGVPPDAERQLLIFSGTPIQLLDEFYILTAGHIFEKHLPILDSKRAFQTGGSLVDCFGIQKKSSKYEKSFPYDFFKNCVYWINSPEQGLDYAMLKLNKNEVELLRANGILPYAPSEQQYKFSSVCRHMLLYGFPEEHAKLISWKPGGETNILAKPCVLEAFRFPEKSTERYPMICAQIYNNTIVNSIVGMSGGPVFASFKTKDGLSYNVAGIQSSWIKEDGTIFATRIDCIVEHFWAWKKANA